MGNIQVKRILVITNKPKFCNIGQSTLKAEEIGIWNKLLRGPRMGPTLLYQGSYLSG